MTDVVDAFFEAFNRADLDGVGKLFAPGYDYAEPALGRVVDAAEHLDAMREYLELIPDRRIEVGERRSTPGGVAVECRYTGTRAADNGRVDLRMTAVFDLGTSADQVTRLRLYYELPS